MENLNKDVTKDVNVNTNVQDGKKREFAEERFDFELYVNDNLICKRNFKINGFIEGSMNTIEFKDAVNFIVYKLDEDLKSKSRIYMHYNFLPENEASEFNEPLIEPWACTFKLVIYDNKKEVMSRIWDGYGYPKAIREKIDFTNKYVKFTNKAGKTFIFEKDAYFAERGEMLPHEMYVLKQMLNDREDALLGITRKICETCSSFGGTFQKKSDYTLSERYSKRRHYAYSLAATNAKIEDAWAKATAKKTKAYFDSLK